MLSGGDTMRNAIEYYAARTIECLWYHTNRQISADFRALCGFKMPTAKQYLLLAALALETKKEPEA
jgi:hypothetical protein